MALMCARRWLVSSGRWVAKTVTGTPFTDTLTYLAGENHDRFQGRWRVSEWPGVSAGRGTIHQETWKSSGRNGQHRGWK